MAGKVPVGGSIARAYGFAFGNIVGNLGAIWLPVLLLWVGTYLLQPPMATQLQAQHDPQAALRQAPMLLGLIAVGLIAQSAQLAALTKEALGLRSGSAFLQFPFGAAMWRTLGSLLLFGIVMFIIYIGLILATAILSGVFAVALKGYAIAAVVVLFSMLLCAIFYIATRMSFFLPAVSVAEHKVSLIRAWQLTSGNFWRIFAVMFVILLPFVILEIVFIVTLIAPFIHSFHANMSQAETLALQQQIIASMTETPRRLWYVTYPVGLLVSLLLYGTYTGAASFAYRAVAGDSAVSEVF
jgi:hypothetical protein